MPTRSPGRPLATRCILHRRRHGRQGQDAACRYLRKQGALGRLSPDGALHHLLFSPAGPSRLMFCHEGPWHKVDRIWAMWTDGTAVTKIHTRTMAMEIFGHEFWSPDG